MINEFKQGVWYRFESYLRAKIGNTVFDLTDFTAKNFKIAIHIRNPVVISILRIKSK